MNTDSRHRRRGGSYCAPRRQRRSGRKRARANNYRCGGCGIAAAHAERGVFFARGLCSWYAAAVDRDEVTKARERGEPAATARTKQRIRSTMRVDPQAWPYRHLLMAMISFCNDEFGAAIASLEKATPQELTTDHNRRHRLWLLAAAHAGDLGFPSAYRGTKAQASSLLVMEEATPPMEKNGFTIIDLTPEQIRLRLFAWRPPDRVEQIDELEPAFSVELSRRR